MLHQKCRAKGTSSECDARQGDVAGNGADLHQFDSGCFRDRKSLSLEPNARERTVDSINRIPSTVQVLTRSGGAARARKRAKGPDGIRVAKPEVVDAAQYFLERSGSAYPSAGCDG
jgi:hypothetical protein